MAVIVIIGSRSASIGPLASSSARGATSAGGSWSGTPSGRQGSRRARRCSNGEVLDLEARRQGVAVARSGYEVAPPRGGRGRAQSVAGGEDVAYRNRAHAVDEVDAAEYDGSRAVA